MSSNSLRSTWECRRVAQPRGHTLNVRREALAARLASTCWQAGIVLAGESAGSLCWHSGATTDSYGPVQPLTDGLGFLPHSNAVHYTDRRDQFRHLVGTGALPPGYATDAGAGLVYHHTDLVDVIADRPHATAYHVTPEPDTPGAAIEQPLPARRLP